MSADDELKLFTDAILFFLHLIATLKWVQTFRFILTSIHWESKTKYFGAPKMTRPHKCNDVLKKNANQTKGLLEDASVSTPAKERRVPVVTNKTQISLKQTVHQCLWILLDPLVH